MKLLIKSIRVYFLCVLAYGLLHNLVHAEDIMKGWAIPIDKSFNFYQVTPLLYRSAMPDSSKIDVIKAHQITTILSFIKDDDRKWLGNDVSINVISYPTHADRVTDDDVLKVLRIIQQAQQKGGAVLMHCKHGQNRTGLFMAMYRIIIQHWTKEEAVFEMAKGGYSTDLKDIEDAIAYIRKSKVKKIRLALATHQCSTRKFAFCHLFGKLINN